MGFYINPKDMSKEEWFEKNKQRFVGHVAPVNHYLKDDDYVVCVLVDNGPFTALAICYSNYEMRSLNMNDGRWKIWAYFPRKIVEPYLHGQKIEGVEYEP